LAERMGLSILPGGAGPDACTDEQLFASMVAGTSVPWDVLVEAAGRPVQFPREDRWVERTVLRNGRWDLSPPLLRQRLEHALSRPQANLVLGNRREVHHTNSTLAWGLEEASRPQTYVYLSPADAAPAGVEDGDAVEVLSAHGDLRGTAKIDPALAPGTVVVPHGFSDPNVGHLTATDVDVDPLTGMPTLVGVPVSVGPLTGRAAPERPGGTR
jgi:anaerobic selenocysteine-containing dehydrogenase